MPFCATGLFVLTMYTGERSDPTRDYVVFFSPEIRETTDLFTLPTQLPAQLRCAGNRSLAQTSQGPHHPCLLPAVLSSVLPQRLPFSVSPGSVCLSVCYIHSVCRILVPRPGSEPGPTAVNAPSALGRFYYLAALDFHFLTYCLLLRFSFTSPFFERTHIHLCQLQRKRLSAGHTLGEKHFNPHFLPFSRRLERSSYKEQI